MRRILTLAIVSLFGATTGAFSDETKVRVGNIDAVLTVPADVERPAVALLIAGSGSTDHDGNGPQARPATLKKLAEQLAERKIATLRYDKRGAGGWKAEFGRPEDFRFKDYVDDAGALVNYLHGGKFSRVVVIGHSEGGLVAILAARQVAIDRLVLLVTAARPQGDLVKAQLARKQIPADILQPILKAIDDIMAGQIVDPPPRGLSIAPAMQPSLASGFTIDPIDPLKSIHQPILIVGGGRDLQVARLDFIALSTASPLAKTLWFPDMNHVLVDVSGQDDNLAAYGEPERPLDAGLVDGVAAFILADRP